MQLDHDPTRSVEESEMKWLSICDVVLCRLRSVSLWAP